LPWYSRERVNSWVSRVYKKLSRKRGQGGGRWGEEWSPVVRTSEGGWAADVTQTFTFVVRSLRQAEFCVVPDEGSLLEGLEGTPGGEESPGHNKLGSRMEEHTTEWGKEGDKLNSKIMGVRAMVKVGNPRKKKKGGRACHPQS